MSQNENRSEMRDLEMDLAQMDQIKAQIEALRSQMASLRSILIDYGNSHDVVKEIITTGQKDVLMPIGGSAFLRVEVRDPKHCIVDQGAGIFMDTPLDEALVLVEKRMENIRKGITNLEGTVQEMLKRYDEIATSAQEIYSRQMSSGAGPEKTF